TQPSLSDRIMRCDPCVAFLAFALPLCSTQLPVRNYTTADGLLRDSALCVVPDSRGFIWLCTAEGLSRFDGYQFVNYSVLQGFAHRTVTGFLQTQKGVYLAATEYGISRLNRDAPPGSPQKFQPIPLAGGGDTSGVYALFEDNSGIVWGGTVHGLYRLDDPGAPRPVLHFVDLQISPQSVVSSLAEDRYGSLWAGTSSGLVRR